MAQKNEPEKYRDMLELPHPDPKTRSRMPQSSRAVQFASFDALTGFDDVVNETVRETEERAELTEDELSRINEQLLLIKEHISERPAVRIVFFVRDEKKKGGSYRFAESRVRHIDKESSALVLTNGLSVPFEDIRGLYAEVSG